MDRASTHLEPSRTIARSRDHHLVTSRARGVTRFRTIARSRRRLDHPEPSRTIPNHRSIARSSSRDITRARVVSRDFEPSLGRDDDLTIPDHPEPSRTIGRRHPGHSSLPKWGGWGKRPSAAGPDEEGPAGISAQDLARRQVLASAVRVRAPRNITSSVGDGAEGRAVRAANRAHQELQEERQPLEKDSWVFYKAKYDCCEDKSCGGCHIPFLLGQLVGDLSELDTIDPDTRVEVKC